MAGCLALVCGACGSCRKASLSYEFMVGAYHELLSSDVVYQEHADLYLPKTEEIRYFGKSSKFGGMTVSEAQRLKALEAENAKLKRLLAETMLDRRDQSHVEAAAARLGIAESPQPNSEIAVFGQDILLANVRGAPYKGVSRFPTIPNHRGS
jgi:hypothetical protein